MKKNGGKTFARMVRSKKQSGAVFVKPNGACVRAGTAKDMERGNYFHRNTIPAKEIESL